MMAILFILAIITKAYGNTGEDINNSADTDTDTGENLDIKNGRVIIFHYIFYFTYFHLFSTIFTFLLPLCTSKNSLDSLQMHL